MIFSDSKLSFSPLRRSSVDLEESHELPHKYRKKLFLVQDSCVDDVNAEDEKDACRIDILSICAFEVEYLTPAPLMLRVAPSLGTWMMLIAL